MEDKNILDIATYIRGRTSIDKIEHSIAKYAIMIDDATVERLYHFNSCEKDCEHNIFISELARTLVCRKCHRHYFPKVNVPSSPEYHVFALYSMYIRLRKMKYTPDSFEEDIIRFNPNIFTTSCIVEIIGSPVWQLSFYDAILYLLIKEIYLSYTFGGIRYLKNALTLTQIFDIATVVIDIETPVNISYILDRYSLDECDYIFGYLNKAKIKVYLKREILKQCIKYTKLISTDDEDIWKRLIDSYADEFEQKYKYIRFDPY